ncbi:MAG: hypothetical protein BWY68_00971 [bacterium ADurb.Bin400]|nr:MAG: hypothetical protein BWY68_00971 [bacterium ADurb.Bin400]
MFLVILYVSYVARAGLVVAIDELEGRKNELTFGSAYHAGRQYFWRLFGFDILISLVAIGLLMIMIAPVILLFIAAGKSPAVLALAILLAIIVFLIFIVVIIYFGILRLLGSRALVINNLGIRASISYGHQMIINKKGYSVLAWLVSLLVGLVYGIALGIAVIIVGLILFAVGYGIYKAAGSVGQVPITVTMIGIFIALLMFVSGVFTSFISTYWTLTFRAIDYYFKKDKEISVNP